MVAIQGIGGIPDPTPERAAKIRDTKERETTKNAPADGVLISSEAQAAAKVARTIQSMASQPDIRADRVEAARQNIERGNYKNPDVVAKVAEKISKYLP